MLAENGMLVGSSPPGESAVDATRPSAVARLLPAARIAVGLIVAASVGYAVISQWTEVRDAISGLAWQAVLASLCAALVGIGCNAMAYRSVLHGLGTDVSPRTASQVFLIGQLGKYVPGSVWAYLLQMELGHRAGIPRAKAFIAALAVTGLAVVAALSIGVIGIPALIQAGETTVAAVLAVIAPIALVCAHPKVLTYLVNVFLRLIHKNPLEQAFTSRGVLHALGWSGVAWLCFGAHLWLLVYSVTGTGLHAFAVCVGAFALAMIAGLLAFLAPSGLGAREAVIVAALTPYTSPGTALGLALASRLVFTVGDVVAAGIAALSGVGELRRAKAVTAD